MHVHPFSPLLMLMLCAGTLSSQAAPPKPKFMLVIHGGAGAIRQEQMTPELEVAYVRTLDSALHKGYDVLNRGGSSLDAVQAAIQLLEDSPLFNAGRGSVFTSAGTNELDASIM